ncbi:alpha-galactosidase [Halococcus sp. IIIV-5B]|uniref:alpha-galactosidase n=1 Tax=Halococcus sp. IIIV-5B TaxID=2321230 RepID=UPI000E76D5FB|nr:alpha-galactosidase [Halococcus sp. IIIV-5B]RJT07179.1 alpha-galactosidase [Halococcus sp. IIIV-5B]
MPKIAFIGAGSSTFARNLLSDILSYDALAGSEIALMDIDPERLNKTRKLAVAMVDQHDLAATVTTTTDREAALDNADYVLNAINVGGRKPFENEIEIPRGYGVKQAVGDTLGPGGVFRAMRTLPVLLDIAHDMEVYCPDALLLNYTNPMAILCWAVDEATDVEVVGLCHSVQHTADALAHYANVERDDLEYWVAGINHMAWFLDATADGESIYPALSSAAESDEVYDSDSVRFELLDHFGYFVTESSHHLSEYLPYFRTDEEIIADLTVEEEVERGGHTAVWMETGSYLDFWLDSSEGSTDTDLKDIELKHSNEYAATIINAIEMDTACRVNVNVRNQDHSISNLPAEACVEVPCLVDGRGIHPCSVGDLPEQLAALIRTNISVQERAVEAGLHCSENALRQAVKLDPLTGAALSLNEVDTMVDDLLNANETYLPSFK